MRAWAKGLLCLEAAVGLLIGHSTWLYRRDFLDAAVELITESGRDIAFVDFTAAADALASGGLPCSQLGRRTSDVERIVLSHFHDDHVGSAVAVAQWSPSAVVAGRADMPFIRGTEPGPWPALTAAEQALNPPMPGTVAPPPPCRVDHEAADGDVLDFAGGAVVLHVGGHTPGSIALHLPRLGRPAHR
jgi:glyoxylase-like metal-dependent hydrolase (beta-lactamase superfamily II)